jgi:hypothetical protein
MTLAARIFQWHATLAPYAGIATTFLLALFAGLLYLSMFGRSGATDGHLSESPAGSNEPVAAPVMTLYESTLTAPTYDRPESPLPQTPTVRLELPPSGSSTQDAAIAAAPAAVEATSAQPAAAEAPIQENGSPAAVPSDATISAAEQASQPAFTQETGAQPASPITYPRTPFAAFDFSPTQPAEQPGVNPAAVMHVPLQDGLMPVAPR